MAGGDEQPGKADPPSQSAAHEEGETLRRPSSTMTAFTAQCANCHKWRKIPTLEQYETIRANYSKVPFVCEHARPWNPTVSCQDPTDLEQDGSLLWAMDKHDIPKPPPGWRRRIVVRGGNTKKFSDVYYHSPCGKSLRSSNETERFLLEFPEYGRQGITLSDFSFTSPRPLQPGNPSSTRGKRPASERPASEPAAKKTPESVKAADMEVPGTPERRLLDMKDSDGTPSASAAPAASEPSSGLSDAAVAETPAASGAPAVDAVASASASTIVSDSVPSNTDTAKAADTVPSGDAPAAAVDGAKSDLPAVSADTPAADAPAAAADAPAAAADAPAAAAYAPAPAADAPAVAADAPAAGDDTTAAADAPSSAAADAPAAAPPADVPAAAAVAETEPVSGSEAAPEAVEKPAETEKAEPAVLGEPQAAEGEARGEDKTAENVAVAAAAAASAPTAAAAADTGAPESAAAPAEEATPAAAENASAAPQGDTEMHDA